MKIKNLLLSALLFVSALAPILSAQPQPLPFTGPLLSDSIQLTRAGTNGTTTYPTTTLQAIQNIYEPTGGSGISITPLVSGTFIISSALQNSPSAGIGYSTGIGTGQTVTQQTNKSTAVVMPAQCFTGTITMNNASLANGALVKFTVTDSAVAATDLVYVTAQSGSITAASGYLFSTNATNGAFTVNVYNAGTTESDAIILDFIVLRGSGN